MIRQWEILHYPSPSDSDRYRLSLWSDAEDAARVRGLFPQRAGVVWVPQRKPYNCSFFLYGISDRERKDLEGILSGKSPFPEASVGLVAADPKRQRGAEDTQEFLVKFDAVVSEAGAVTAGLGQVARAGALNLGYLAPDYLPDAPDRLDDILARTLYEKKVSIVFEKKFSLLYNSLSLKEIHHLFAQCRQHGVKHVIAVGEPLRLRNLAKAAQDKKIFLKPISESVIDRNLWLTVIAELLSYD